VSIQAVGWVLDQDAKHLPPKPRLVLLAIANHADHTSGYCFLHMDTIAQESAIPIRSLFRYIGALVRNGFLRKQLRRGDDGKQRATDYWLLFDRAGTEWKWDAKLDDDDETQDIVEPSANMADGESDLVEGGVMPDLADGPSAIGGTAESLDEPSKTKPEKGARAESAGAPPRRYRPPPVAPLIQGDLHPDARKPIFVRCGTPAWDAWVRYKTRERRTAWTLTTTVRIDGERRTGWHFPTLFPPGESAQSESAEEASATGPPSRKTA
jgi:hypothetical protein